MGYGLGYGLGYDARALHGLAAGPVHGQLLRCFPARFIADFDVILDTDGPRAMRHARSRSFVLNHVRLTLKCCYFVLHVNRKAFGPDFLRLRELRADGEFNLRIRHLGILIGMMNGGDSRESLEPSRGSGDENHDGDDVQSHDRWMGVSMIPLNVWLARTSLFRRG